MSARDSVGIVGPGAWLVPLVAPRREAAPLLVLSAPGEVFSGSGERVAAAAGARELAERCHLILLAMRAAELRGWMATLGEHVDGSHLVVHAVRGLEPGSHRTGSQVVAAESCARKVGALLGPGLTEEIHARGPAAAVVASRFPEVIAETQRALGSERLRVYGSRDLLGVEVASAASSVIGFALGLCLEMGLGAASAAVLLTRGVAEMGRLCEAMGGEERTSAGLAGLGDVLVQREADLRDVRAGRLFARGRTREEIEAELGPVDALEAAPTFRELAAARQVRATVTAAVTTLLEGRLSAREVIARMMTAAPIAE